MIVAAIIGHVLLFLLATRYSLTFVVAALLFIVVPFSVSYLDSISLINGFKFLRFEFTLLILIAGFVHLRRSPFGPAGAIYLLFILVFIISAAWSMAPSESLLYKLQFGLLALAGLMIAGKLNSLADLQEGARIMTMGGAMWALVVLSDFVVHPGSIGRLSPYNINANGAGVLSAFAFIFAYFVALHDRSRPMRIVAICVAVTNALTDVGTGSRGAVLMALVAFVILSLTVVRDPRRFLGVMLALTVLGAVAWQLVDEGAMRLGDTTFDREDNWNFGLEMFFRSPLYGSGWVAVAAPTSLGSGFTIFNTHMMYIQILGETGVLGGSIFLAALVATAVRLKKGFTLWKHQLRFSAPAVLCAAILAACLLDGLFYIGPIVGSNIDALIFAFGLGLADQLPRLAREELESIRAQQAWAIDSAGIPDAWGEIDGYPAHAAIHAAAARAGIGGAP